MERDEVVEYIERTDSDDEFDEVICPIDGMFTSWSFLLLSVLHVSILQNDLSYVDWGRKTLRIQLR